MRFSGLLLGVFFATAAHAQTGGLDVVVTDQARTGPLRGATVVLSSVTQQVPTTANRRKFAASTTHSRSRTQVSNERLPACRSESPQPRESWRNTLCS